MRLASAGGEGDRVRSASAVGAESEQRFHAFAVELDHRNPIVGSQRIEKAQGRLLNLLAKVYGRTRHVQQHYQTERRFGRLENRDWPAHAIFVNRKVVA